MESPAPPEPAAPAPRRAWVGWVLRLLGPVILAVLIYRLDDPAQVFRTLASAKPLPLAIALALNVLPLWLKVVRWQIIVRTRGIRYATKPALLGFSASVFLGMITPGRVGDVLRIHYLRHDTGVRYAEGLAFLLIDRLADLWVIAAFTSYAVVRWSSLLSPDLAKLGWVMVAGSLLAPLPLFVPGLGEKLLGRVYKKLAREPEADGLATFLATLRKSAVQAALPVLGLTLLAYFVSFAQGSILAAAIGIDLPIIEAACLQSVQGLLGLLPISVSGLGIREAFFAAIFPKLGFTAAGGTSFGLGLFVVTYLAQVVLGAIAWQIRPPPSSANAGGRGPVGAVPGGPASGPTEPRPR
jgi:uncharacterized protein (TIRG00374 family)